MSARFVRLGITGFKSFADATTIEILPGLTGIVGPNGCGKSNVAEALRWAMGEANARHLRGGEMDDIIFAGTANRPSRNLAEVALTIEEDDAALPPPFANHKEVQVVRRIERGGGSVYRVNGREARARDVQTLFADLASGARSSAMVSQGRVGMLVNARPEERRAVLEEAAGITGLHSRRSEAETRLRATEGNLERAEERRVLLARQADGLAVQATQAARYRLVIAGMQEAEATFLAIQRARALQARDDAIAAVTAARSQVADALAVAATASSDAERQLATLPRLREAEAVAVAASERAKMALEGVTEELARAQAALANAERRKAQLASDLAHAEQILSDSETVDARLVAEFARLTDEIARHPTLLQVALSEAERAAESLHVADRAANEAAAAASMTSAQTSAAQQLLQQAQARHQRAIQSRRRLDAEAQQADAGLVSKLRVAEAETNAAAANSALTEAREELAAAENARASAIRALASIREKFSREDVVRHRLAAEASALAEILSVKDGERWPPMIDSLTVPQGLEAALGAVLGEELAAAADPTAARHWRELPELSPRPLPGIGLAGQVTAPPMLARALGAIGLVQSEAEGDHAQAGLAPGQSIVSATGAVWRWDGYTVRAGTPTAATVRLQQRNRLVKLQSGLRDAEATVSATKQILDTAMQADQKAAAALDQARQRQRAAESLAERARVSAQALNVQSEAGQARWRAIQEQLQQLQPELDAAEIARQAAESAVAELPDSTVLKAAAETTRAAINVARQRDSAAARAVEELGRLQASRQNRLVAIDRERDDRRMRVTDLAGRVVDLRARAQEASADLAKLMAAPGHIQAGAEAAKAQVVAKDAARATVLLQRQEAEAAAAATASAARAAEQTGYAAREALVRAEAALAAAEHALGETMARIAEREGALPALPQPTDLSATAEERAKTRLNRLARERDEIGPVNLRADIEAAAIEADIGTIDRERDDLASAIAKLRGTIGHLNREGRERLTAVFQAVDRHFQALFARMFGGGRAHLALVGSDDPLEAGLEIYAQPPGKKLSALSLLSGGEQALTALSLIFAVFRCNPAPLCILDEVDAPLDDANVGRFCALLTDMVRETGTRFLVVTHHQVTMAAMDRLYGVTMQERGVSRLLSVDLTRAVSMVEAIAAE